MKESSLSITFGVSDDPGGDDPIGDDPGSANYISIGLDSDANDSATSFEPDSTAFLKVSSGSAYGFNSSGGELKTDTTNLPMTITDETITFANENTATLRYLPSGAVTYSWVGDSGGNPVFDGRNILIPETVIGVLKCSYTTLFDRLSLTFPEEGDVVVVVTITDGTDTANITVSFVSADDEDAEPVAYELEVKDYCTDELLLGATVYLDGVEIGQTNAGGIIALGALVPGSTHTLKMAKGGYINSENDKLNNDSFTIPS